MALEFQRLFHGKPRIIHQPDSKASKILWNNEIVGEPSRRAGRLQGSSGRPARNLMALEFQRLFHGKPRIIHQPDSKASKILWNNEIVGEPLSGESGYKVALGVPPGPLWRSSSRDHSMENPGSFTSQIPKHRKSFGTMKSLASHFLAKAATWEL
jgi:hypothetical protein